MIRICSYANKIIHTRVLRTAFIGFFTLDALGSVLSCLPKFSVEVVGLCGVTCDQKTPALETWNCIYMLNICWKSREY